MAYLHWMVGDILQIAVKVEDFCSTELQKLDLGSNDLQKYPNPYIITCNRPNCAYSCIDTSNRQVRFKSVLNSHSVMNDVNCSNLSYDKFYRDIGSINTDPQGIAVLVFTVTEQDRQDYLNAVSMGGSYDIVCCMTDSLAGGDSVVFSGITILQACPDQCYGLDLWSMKRDPATGLCVQDVLKEANSMICTATHYLDLKVRPHPWYTPHQAIDQLIILIAEINGAIMNWMTFLTGWTYLGTTINLDGNYVLIRIHLKEEVTSIQSLTPATAGQIALLVVVIGLISLGVGPIFSVLFGTKDAIQDVGLTNGNLTEAGETFIKGTLTECETKTCSDPSLTQDQKTTCIKNCYEGLLQKWKQYNENLFPDADHTPLSDALTQIQTCYDTYNNSAKTQQDYDVFNACMQIKSNEGIDKDNGNIMIIYPPDAPAGSKEVHDAEDCWIPGLAGGCLLTAKTGKTIALIGGVVIAGFVVISLIKK